MASVLRCALFLLCVALGVEGARVLMFLPAAGKSMKNVFYGMGKALSSRGHEVVFFSPFKPSSPVDGIEEVVPDELAKFFADDETFPNVFEMQKQGMQAGLKQFMSIFVEGPRLALASKEVDDILKQKFDIVILTTFAYPVYAIPYLLKAPFVVLTPLAYIPILNGPLGNPTLPAISPLPMTSSTDQMAFLERVGSVVGHVVMNAIFRFVYMPYSDRLVAEKFGPGVIPPAAEIERNVSLIFQSSNPIVDYHKPLLPNVVEVGGMHCEPPKPLPKELKNFLGDSEFIYFSLGSVVKPKDMPAELRSAVLSALGAVPFKVLLKWDTTDRAGIPANILPSKWLPQQDILGDSKCRLFISHGGFASVLESLCHGVPMVTIPLSGDQNFNAANAVRLGTAELLSWDDLTSETLQAAIRAALSPAHLAAARYRKELLSSQPISPRDLAVHWVEHVIRHGGAPHLRSVGADLNFLQYYSLDVLALLLLLLVVVLKLMVAAVKCCCRCVCGSSKAPPPAKAKAKRQKRD